MDKVAYVAGHSLGEYSALAAAGTFSVGDTARLLRIRGNAMQAAVPGGRGRDGRDHRPGASRTWLRHAAEAALGLGLPGRQRQWRRPAGDLRRQGRRRARRRDSAPPRAPSAPCMLQVSAPFHSALMPPAADAMAQALATVTKHRPAVPVVANVAVRPLTDPDEIAPPAGRAGDRPRALARDREWLARQRRDHALSRSAPARCCRAWPGASTATSQRLRSARRRMSTRRWLRYRKALDLALPGTAFKTGRDT